jgi:hypothetical protein
VDALTFSPFAVAGILFGVAGFVLGRLQREFRYQREARDNLAIAVARTDANQLPVAVSVPDDDDNDDGTQHRSVGRRAIPRTDVRARPGRYAAGRNTRSADASPVRVLEFDCDRG